MTAATIYRDFNRSAIASNLSGRQMQLWLKLYEFLHSYRRQDVQLYTPMLLDMLNISLSQFRRARQGLIEAGFLSIRQDSQQHTSYTLLLNGRAISFVPEKQDQLACNGKNTAISSSVQSNDQKDFSTPPFQGSGRNDKHAILPKPVCNDKYAVISSKGSPEPQSRDLLQSSPQYPSGDIMLNGGYQADLQQFFRSFPDTALSGWLQQWADMRRKNGWTLTRWGLTALLDKLQSLSGGNLQTMAAIVKQSVSRRWKGFYPLKAERKPSGEKLLRMEQQQRSRQPIHQKFKPEQRDLSFLER